MASKGRKQKVKFQWTKELGFLIGALVVIIAATIILAIPTKAEKLENYLNFSYNKKALIKLDKIAPQNNISARDMNFNILNEIYKNGMNCQIKIKHIFIWLLLVLNLCIKNKFNTKKI